jgi:phosphate acetyltransferase
VSAMPRTALIDALMRAAAARNGAIVLPEGDDPRIREAAAALTRDGIARVTLLGTEDPPAGVDAADPETDPRRDSYAERYAAQRDVSPAIAARLLKKPLFFGAMMVAAGDADAMVAGAANPTRRVIEAGLMAVGLAEGIETPSSFFLMVLPGRDGAAERAFVFADCALNVDPTAEQLADIALASAASAARLLAETPRVAMLSFSTHGSSAGASVDKVRRATEIVRGRAPALAVDGELQADAAISAAVAAAKVKRESDVAGAANVLVFPDLNSGNIGYKLTQQMAGAAAIGPILQGFARPVSDLSRGASVADIVAASGITLALG